MPEAPPSRPPTEAAPGAPAETPGRTLLVAATVCVGCALLVSTTAVLLRPLKEAHLARVRNAYILEVLETIPGIASEIGQVDAADLEARVIDLETGDTVPDVDPAAWDPLRAAEDPAQSVALPAARDTAGLGRRERWATVYLLRDQGDDERVRLVVLPVRGQGFQSMLHGYLALDADLDTVLGLTFYQQEETPGLGSLITEPGWLAQWHGKRARDGAGALRLGVAKGGPAEPDSLHEVDGISGATWTGDGVTNLLRFWLGGDGYGPFLRRLGSP